MKNATPRPGAALAGAALMSVLLTTTGALAQQVGGPPGTTNGMLTGPVVGAASGQQQKAAQPPALPGSRTTDSDPAPAEKLASEMRPNEALFDSVNRGDINSARDAIGRGADLNAHNVLGLTALELSVDLGRNDITFLLLSMRGASGGAAALAGDTDKPASPARTASRADSQHPAPRPVVASTPRPAPPRQYADNPGTPVPQAGFLGFGGAAR